MKDPQHDEHCNRFDEKLWADWPPTVSPATAEEQASIAGAAELTHEDKYVISKSDSIEHLYYQEIGNQAKWVVLALASQYDRGAMQAHAEPTDGFWMTLVRAQELEE